MMFRKAHFSSGHDLKDFAGKKVRVFASPIQTDPMKRLDATAVPMALSEVLPALQQGTLDGVMSGRSPLSAKQIRGDKIRHVRALPDSACRANRTPNRPVDSSTSLRIF